MGLAAVPFGATVTRDIFLQIVSTVIWLISLNEPQSNHVVDLVIFVVVSLFLYST